MLMQKLSIGMVQGRLTPSKGRGIQFFPNQEGEWEKEFARAAELGIQHIQWAFETVDNPLLLPETQARVRAAVAKTGVPVWHMDMQLLTSVDISACGDVWMQSVCEALAAVDGQTVEVPLMEASSLLDVPMREQRVAALRRFMHAAAAAGISLAVETDLPPKEYTALLEQCPLGAVYDAGNSAGMGYLVDEEFAAYGASVVNVHIKDKKKGGVTVPLGSGDADLKRLFQLLRKVPYTGPVTLQAARGEDGKEAETIQHYIDFINAQYEQSF